MLSIYKYVIYLYICIDNPYKCIKKWYLDFKCSSRLISIFFFFFNYNTFLVFYNPLVWWKVPGYGIFLQQMLSELAVFWRFFLFFSFFLLDFFVVFLITIYYSLLLFFAIIFIITIIIIIIINTIITITENQQWQKQQVFFYLQTQDYYPNM